MSYAHPSPPIIQWDFFIRYCFRLSISAVISVLSLLQASITFSEAVLDASALFLSLSHSSKAALVSSFTDPAAMASSILSLILSRILPVPSASPNPNSALSSKSEFAQAGPRPILLWVYGIDGADPLYMEEHPVALLAIIRSPKSCVMALRYGVSPQPAHAPENSNNGCAN